MSKIVAVVVTEGKMIAGGAPIFITQSREEQIAIATSLEKIMDAAAHELKNGMIILIDHRSKE